MYKLVSKQKNNQEMGLIYNLKWKDLSSRRRNVWYIQCHTTYNNHVIGLPLTIVLGTHSVRRQTGILSTQKNWSFMRIETSIWDLQIIALSKELIFFTVFQHIMTHNLNITGEKLRLVRIFWLFEGLRWLSIVMKCSEGYYFYFNIWNLG